MKIAVCDEDKMVRDDIVYLIKKQIPDVDIFTFVSGEELIDCGEDFDISFIDIEMEKMTGIDTAKKIRAKQERQGKIKSIIIFITKYSDYMESAFDVNAYHYLLKPIDNEKFSEVLKRAWKDITRTSERTSKYIMVKSFGIQHKIFVKDIYILLLQNQQMQSLVLLLHFYQLPFFDSNNFPNKMGHLHQAELFFQPNMKL